MSKGSRRVLGKVSDGRAIRGKIGRVNVWDTILHKHSVVYIFRGQGRARGNTFSWEQIRKAIPGGLSEVEVQGELQSINKGINVLGTGSVRSLPVCQKIMASRLGRVKEDILLTKVGRSRESSHISFSIRHNYVCSI